MNNKLRIVSGSEEHVEQGVSLYNILWIVAGREEQVYSRTGCIGWLRGGKSR